MLQEVKQSGVLGDTVAFMHALLEPSAYVGMGKGTQLITAPFRVPEGTHQGAVESSWLFSIAVNKPFQRANNRMAEQGGGLVAIIDDNYITGPPALAFETNKMLAEDLKKMAGLELQPKKSKCYISPAYRVDGWDSMRGDIEEGVLKREDGEEVRVNGELARGMTVCNVPIGTEEFVLGYLEQKLKKILKGYDKLIELLDPGRWPNPDIPTRQMLWVLTVACLQFMGDYWIRHVRPDLTETFAEGVDAGVQKLFKHCVGVNTETWSEVARERMRLPIRHKGCGLREARDRRFAQFLGGGNTEPDASDGQSRWGGKHDQRQVRHAADQKSVWRGGVRLPLQLAVGRSVEKQ